MKLLAMAALFATFGFSQFGYSDQDINFDKKPPIHKCPKGQHWDTNMKMCMPN